MASRDKFSRYDSPEVINNSIRDMEKILSSLKHKVPRTSVLGAISGLKKVLNDLDFGKEKTDRLKKQQKRKDEISRAAARNSMERWTDYGDQLVLTSGLSDFEIGKALGKSRNAVACRRKRLMRSKQEE